VRDTPAPQVEMICDGFEKRIAIEKLITVDVNKEIKIYNII